MPELSGSSPLTAALAAHFLLSVASALTALVAWRGFRRLREDALRDTTWAFAVVTVIHAALVFAQGTGLAAPAPLLRALESAAAAVMGWPFFNRGRRVFLISSILTCGMLGAFTLSLSQLDRMELAWVAMTWWLVSAAIYGATTFSLWLQRRERSLMLLGAFALLTAGSIIGAAGLAEGMIILQLVAFPLMMVALMQLSTRDLESAQAELLSFSEYSLRQTQQLLTLLRASTTFLVHAEMKVILHEAAEGVAVGVGADSVFVALLDETSEQVLHVQAAYPPESLPLDAVIPLSSQPAITDAVQLHKQVVLTQSQRGVHALAALLGNGAGPAIIQPLLCQQRVLGVMVAFNGRSHRTFTEGEQRVLEAFGAQVAAAAENALLDEVIEQQTRELAELLNLKEEEARRRAAILQSIADGVIVFDHQQQAVLANPAVCDMLDLAEPNLLGQPMREIMAGRVHQEDYEVIRSRIESEQPLPPGFKVVWGSKTIAISVAPVKLTAANRRGAVMALHDITHDAEVDRMKNEFVMVVSHELRSPFAELDASLQLFTRQGLDHLLPEQREQLQQLVDGLKRARTMVNNLVTVAAFLSKQGQLRMASLDLGLVAAEVMDAFSAMAHTRGVTMTSNIADALPPVYGDHDRLVEAVYHLLHNAIKFNRPSGAVTLACWAAQDSVILEVTDTGVGIPPDRLPEMWKDFTQLADPLRRGIEGLGLGLPLVKYVVKAHGGQVWASSQVGEGSVFGFRIPVASHNT